MSDDWKPGDLALCVNDTPNPFAPGDVRRGRIYTVSGLRLGSVRHALFGTSSLGLYLAEVRSGSNYGTFAARRFRKIKPLTDEEREQFAHELNSREQVNA